MEIARNILLISLKRHEDIAKNLRFTDYLTWVELRLLDDSFRSTLKLEQHLKKGRFLMFLRMGFSCKKNWGGLLVNVGNSKFSFLFLFFCLLILAPDCAFILLLSGSCFFQSEL